MADKRITELTPITGANLADDDEFVVVDISANETKSVTRSELFLSVPSITVTGTVTIAGTEVDADAEVNTIDSVPTGITGASQVTNVVSISQSDYDALTPDASTFYIITGA